LPRKGWKASADLGELEIDVIEVPGWARKLPRDYLAESVEERGVIQPILVAAVPNGEKNRNRYILVDGMGRLEIAKKKGLKRIPARIIKLPSEEEALLLAIELEQTKEPWSLEYTLQVIQELLKRGYTKKRIAETLRIPRSKLYRLLFVMEAPEELRKLFLEGKLPLRAADKIWKVLGKLEEELLHLPPGTVEALRDRLIDELQRFPEDYESICESIIRDIEHTKERFIEEVNREEATEEKPEEPKLVPASQIRLPPAKPLTPLEQEEEQEEEAGEEEEVEEVVVEEEVEERPEEAKEEEEEKLPEELLEELRADMRAVYVHLLAAKTKDAVLTTLHEIRAVCEKWIDKLASQ